MLGKFLTSAAAGWAGRRLLDWGGWLGTFLLSLFGLYAALPQSAQGAIQQALSGNWQDITLGSLLPLGALVASQIMSFRATVKPQVVNPDGQKIGLEEMPAASRADTVAATRRVVKKKAEKTLLEKLTGRPE